MNALRWAAVVAVVLVATVAQVVVFPYVAIEGVVPNLALVVVVVSAFARGSRFAAGLGFLTGLLIDLAPPADHVAGRWALALLLAGYLAGRVRQDARSSLVTAVLVVGACSFVGTSIYALSGLALDDGSPDAGSMAQVIAISVLWDLVLAPVLVPVLLWFFDLVRTPRVATGVVG